MALFSYLLTYLPGLQPQEPLLRPRQLRIFRSMPSGGSPLPGTIFSSEAPGPRGQLRSSHVNYSGCACEHTCQVTFASSRALLLIPFVSVVFAHASRDLNRCSECAVSCSVRACPAFKALVRDMSDLLCRLSILAQEATAATSFHAARFKLQAFLSLQSACLLSAIRQDVAL